VRIPIPEGAEFPAVSNNMIRTYGAGGFILAGHELPRGCPRQWQWRYNNPSGERPPGEQADVLDFGSIMHRALQLMEEEQSSPEDSVLKAWSEKGHGLMTPEWYQEALYDIRRYMDRGQSPLDNYANYGTEVGLEAILYEDEDFGPIVFRGTIDWLGLDWQNPNDIHIVDFKTNRFPPSIEDVMRDVQGKGYAWLVLQNAYRLFPGVTHPRPLFTLDAIKWNQLPPVFYDADTIEAWHQWVVAIVRQILRDEDAEPEVNDGCPQCPIRDSCPAWAKVPDQANFLLQVKPDDADELMIWREKVNALRLLLEKAVKEVDGRFNADAAREGQVVAGGMQLDWTAKWVEVQDLPRLHSLLGDDLFYEVASAGKGKLEAVCKGLDPETAEAAMGCLRKEPNGMTVKRTRL